MSGDDEADEPSPGDMTPGASRSGRRRGGGGNPLERTDDDREREDDADEYDSRDDDEDEEDYGAEVEADNITVGSMVTRVAPSHPTSLLELDHQLHDLREGGALTGWAEALNDEPHDMHALVTRKELTARAFAMRTALLVRTENRRPMPEHSGSESEGEDAPQEDGFAVDEFPQQPRWNRRRAVDMQAREGVSVYPPDPMPACRIYQRPIPLASANGTLRVPAAKAIDDDADGGMASRKKALALGGPAVHETSRQAPAVALRAVTGHTGANTVAGFAELELELRSVAFFDHPAFRLEDCLAMKLRSLYGAYDARVGAARAEIENLQDSAGRRTAKARELVLVGDGVAQLEKEGMHTIAMQAVEAVLAHAEAVMEIRRLAHDVYTCWQEVKGERQHSGETVTTVRLTVSPVRLQMGDATKEWIECAHDLAKALVAFESAKASDDDDDAAVGGDDDDGESGDGSDEEGGGGRRKRRGEVRTRWAAPQNRALDRFAHWVRVLGEDSVLRAGLDAEDYLVDLDEDADISPAVSEAEATRRASITKYSVSARVYVDGRHVTTTGEMPLEWPTYTVPTLQGAPRTIRIRLLHQPKSVELALMWRWKPQQRVLGADRIAIVALPLPAAATESGVAAAASSAAQASVRWVADRPIPVKNWTWQPFGMGGVNSFATQRFVNGTVAAALSWSRRGVLPPPPPSGGGPLTTTADAEAAAHAMWSMQLHDLARERSTLKSGIGALNPNDPRDAPLMKQVEQGGGSGFSAVEGGAAAAANRSDALVRSVFRESAYSSQLSIALTDEEIRALRAAGSLRTDSGASRRLMMRLRRERPWAVEPYGAVPLLHADFSRQLRQMLRQFDNELRARQFRAEGAVAGGGHDFDDELDSITATPPTFIEEQLQEARLRQRALAGSQRETVSKGIHDFVKDKWSFQADRASWTDVIASIFRPESRLNPPPPDPDDAVASSDYACIKMQVVRATNVPSRVAPVVRDDDDDGRKSKRSKSKRLRGKQRPGMQSSGRNGTRSSGGMRSSGMRSSRRRRRQEEDDTNIVNTFVEVRFQHNTPFETPSRFGTSPQWNEKMHLELHTENGKYNQDTLGKIQDVIRIILWDEIELDGKGDRCYLGHVDVPFQTLLQKGRIDGSLALTTPPKFRDPKEDRSTCIGYRRQGFRMVERDGEFLDSPTMINVLIQLDPIMAPPPTKQIIVDHSSPDMDPLLQRAANWEKSTKAGWEKKKISGRYLQPIGMQIDGTQVLALRFLRQHGIAPPEGGVPDLRQVWVGEEEDRQVLQADQKANLFALAHLVALIPQPKHWPAPEPSVAERMEMSDDIAADPAYVPEKRMTLPLQDTCWLTADQQFDMLIAGRVDRAYLLANFFLWVENTEAERNAVHGGGGRRGSTVNTPGGFDDINHKVYVVFGSDILVGRTAWVAQISQETFEVTLWDPATGVAWHPHSPNFANCPLVSVSQVVGCDNIWANVGAESAPMKINWDLDAHGLFKFGGTWSPLFGQKDDLEQVRSEIDKLCVQPDTLSVNPRPTEEEIAQLQQRIETAVGDIVRKGHFATYNPRRAADVFKNLLPDLEAEKLGLPPDDDDEENMIALNALNDEYAVMGCPQHFTFVDLDDLLAQLSASGIFDHEVDNFVNKVLVVGYCNCICSVWVYAAALSSASRRSSY